MNNWGTSGMTMKGKKECIPHVQSSSNPFSLWTAKPEIHFLCIHLLPSTVLSSLHSSTSLLALPQTHFLCKSRSQWRNLVYRQNFILWPICPNILYNEGPLHSGLIKCVDSRVRQSQFPSQLNHLLSVSSGMLLVVVCYPFVK